MGKDAIADGSTNTIRDRPPRATAGIGDRARMAQVKQPKRPDGSNRTSDRTATESRGFYGFVWSNRSRITAIWIGIKSDRNSKRS